MHQLPLVSTSPSRFIFFSVLLQVWGTFLFAFFQFSPVVSQNSRVHELVGSLYYYDYYCYSFSSFSHLRQPMISHRGLSDSKSPRVSGIILNIQADFNVAVVWMFSTCPLIFNSSNSWTNPLETYQGHQLQFVLPSLLCPTVFFIIP